jgi:hypothetical protein
LAAIHIAASTAATNKTIEAKISTIQISEPADDVHNHTQRGGLAGTIRPEKSIDASRGNLDGEVVHGQDFTEGLMYTVKQNCIHI